MGLAWEQENRVRPDGRPRPDGPGQPLALAARARPDPAWAVRSPCLRSSTVLQPGSPVPRRRTVERAGRGWEGADKPTARVAAPAGQADGATGPRDSSGVGSVRVEDGTGAPVRRLADGDLVHRQPEDLEARAGLIESRAPHHRRSAIVATRHVAQAHHDPDLQQKPHPEAALTAYVNTGAV